MRISDWSSDVCSSDLDRFVERRAVIERAVEDRLAVFELADLKIGRIRLTFDSVARVIDHVEAQRLATDPAAQQHGRANVYAFIGMDAARPLVTLLAPYPPDELPGPNYRRHHPQRYIAPDWCRVRLLPHL